MSGQIREAGRAVGRGVAEVAVACLALPLGVSARRSTRPTENGPASTWVPTYG